jgi:AcrR family transcriptional regulator
MSIKREAKMPRIEEENQRIREEQRERIMDAALHVFARKGLTGTKMADIAVEAGVSYGLAYHYFGSKEKIFSALAERAMHGTTNVARAAQEVAGTPWDRIEWLITRELEGLREHSELVMITLQTMTTEAIPEELKQLVRVDGNKFNEILKDLIVEGQRVGQVVPDDPDLLVAAVQACISGLAVGAIFRGHEQFVRSLPGAEIVLRILKT